LSQFNGGGSASDPFKLNDITIALSSLYIGRGNNNTAAKTQVYPSLVGGESTAVILVIGQSECTNYTTTPAFTPVNAKNHNLNIHNGGMYSAVDPLLGCDGAGGNWVSQMADKLITAGTFTRVITAPIAISGASAAEWAPGGVCNHRVGVALARIASLGMTTTHVCYMQGVTDALNGTTKAAYKASVSALFTQLRAAGVTCPILIARNTWTAGAANATIQAGQDELVDVPNDIHAGADCDSLNDTNRIDQTHWNATGRAAVAELWKVVIAAL
jgi:lysophospholipase L1-like esterase